MTQAQWILLLYGGGAVFLLGAWPFAKEKGKQIIGNALLLLLTVFAAHFLTVAYTTQRLGKSNPAVATDQAEMQMRLLACLESLRGAKPGEKLPIKALSEAEAKQVREALGASETALEDAMKLNGKNHMYPAKLIVVLGEGEKGKNKATETRIRELNAKLMAGEPAADKYRELGKVFNHVYVEHEVSKPEVKPFAEIVQNTLPGGWYQDRAITKLYETASEKELLDEHLNAVRGKNVITLAKFMFLATILVVAGLIGAINIVVQLGMISRSQKPPDAVGLSIPLKPLYAVFISWFCIQILMSTFVHALLGQYPEITASPTGTAFSTMLTYLVSNLPAPFLIYFLALRPQGLQFREALRLRMRTSTAGPIKTVIGGILAWCSAIPIIIGAALIANRLLGSQHSDNPVIAQIIQAASASSPLAILLFYFTLGVMAPFFEELLFRGFLYQSLKTRIGTFLSMVISAAMFACIHFDKGGVMMLFAIGFVLAFTFERTRSLVPSMIAHGLWNSGSFTLALVLFSS